MSSEDINDYERTIERLTILFSKGEISEESYTKAIKAIEEKLNKLQKKTTECPQCGKEVPEDLKLCPYCGWRSTPSSLSYTPYVKKPTSWWYLVPFLLGLIGGILGYIAVKDEDKEMADNLLFIGIIMTFIGILVIWAIYSYYISMLSRL